MRVSIFGTSNFLEYDTNAVLNKQVFKDLVDHAEKTIFSTFLNNSWNNVDITHPLVLICTGQAWANFIAIQLFIKWNKENRPVKLEVHMDFYRIDMLNLRFKSTYNIQSYLNGCQNLNQSFDFFSFYVGRNMMEDYIYILKQKNCKIFYHNQYRQKDKSVGSLCDKMIAYTFNEKQPRIYTPIHYIWSCFNTTKNNINNRIHNYIYEVIPSITKEIEKELYYQEQAFYEAQQVKPVIIPIIDKRASINKKTIKIPEN